MTDDESRRLVIRTEAEAHRDHAAAWLWGFACGAALIMSSFVIWKIIFTPLL